MLIISWILQVFIAFFFVKPAVSNLTWSKQKLTENHMLQPEQSPIPNRLIGLCQILGIFGIILPDLIKYKQFLTTFAAIGFALMMIGALIVHKNDKNPGFKGMLIAVIVANVLVAIYHFHTYF